MAHPQALISPQCDLSATRTSRLSIPELITFSGIDGAGKTTQITAIRAHLYEQGYRAKLVTFWDDVAFMSKMRAGVSLAVFRKRPGTSERSALRHPPLRNDKNVRTWYLMLVRAAFYLFDALKLRRTVSKLRREEYDFIIFDRYLYDQLVQIQSKSWLARTYVRLLLSLVPSPEFPFILDASPEEAFARKSEYPLDFMREYRQAFLELCSFEPHLMVIEPSTVDNVQRQIVQHIAMRTDVVPGCAIVAGDIR